MSNSNVVAVATPVSLANLTDVQLNELHDRLGPVAMDALIEADQARQAAQEAAAAKVKARVDAHAALRAKGAASIAATMARIEARRKAERATAAKELVREVSDLVGTLDTCLSDGDRLGADKAIKALQEDDLFDGVVEYFGSRKTWENFLEVRRRELRTLFARPVARRRWRK